MKKEQFAELIQKAVEYGRFVLADGSETPYYVNLRRLTLSTAMYSIARQLDFALAGVEYDAIGGMETGVNQIVGGFLTYAALMDVPDGPDGHKRGFVVLKQHKTHGVTTTRVIGSVRPGDRCVIVEDTVSTGASMLEAMRQVKEFGCTVVHAVAVVERLQGAREQFEAVGVPFTSLLTVKDLNLEPVPLKSPVFPTDLLITSIHTRI